MLIQWCHTETNLWPDEDRRVNVREVLSYLKHFLSVLSEVLNMSWVMAVRAARRSWRGTSRSVRPGRYLSTSPHPACRSPLWCHRGQRWSQCRPLWRRRNGEQSDVHVTGVSVCVCVCVCVHTSLVVVQSSGPDVLSTGPCVIIFSLIFETN